MASTIRDGIGSSDFLSGPAGLPVGPELVAEVGALTMAMRLAPNPLASWRRGSQERQAGGQVALEMAERASPAHKGRKALDSEAGPKERDHGSVVGSGDPGAGRSARPDGVHQVADDGRGERVVDK